MLPHLPKTVGGRAVTASVGEIGIEVLVVAQVDQARPQFLAAQQRKFGCAAA